MFEQFPQPKDKMLRKIHQIEDLIDAREGRRSCCQSFWLFTWIKIEFVALLCFNICLFIIVIYNVNDNVWRGIASCVVLGYCIISNVIYLWMCIKRITWIAPNIIFNQIIALVLNVIVSFAILIDEIMNMNFATTLWSSGIVLLVIAETVFFETYLTGFCGLVKLDRMACCCRDVHHSIYHMHGMYELYLWRYCFEKVNIYDSLRFKAPTKEQTEWIANTLGDGDASDEETVHLMAGTNDETNITLS